MKPLTLQEFSQIPNGQIFRSGVCFNTPGELYMTNERLMDKLIWVAKKGEVEDWAVYCLWYENKEGSEVCNMVARFGQKVHGAEAIQFAVPCTDEVFSLYRQ